MKQFYIFLLLAWGASAVHAQITIDAGADQHWCRGLNADSLLLGGSPTISGGVSPYTVEWSIDPVSFQGSSLTFYASDFLDDTTVTNPWLYELWNDTLTLYLKVTDSQNQTGRDTITITSTTFGSHLGSFTFNINLGDSVQLFEPNISPSSDPNPIWDSVLWRPNEGLIDSTSVRPWVKPEKDIVYYAIVWDEHGCSVEGAPFQYVFVSQMGKSEIAASDHFKIYPTQLPVNGSIVIEKPVDFSRYTCRIVDTQGKTVEKITSSETTQEFKLNGVESGIYVYQIFSEEQLVKTGKLLVK